MRELRKELLMALKPVVLATLVALLAAPALAQPRVTERVSVGDGGAELNGNSTFMSASLDGRYVGFSCQTSIPVDGCVGRSGGHFAPPAIAQVYVRDRQTGATECISKGIDGSSGDNSSEGASVSADGRFVVFHSWATNLIAPRASQQWGDVFVRDRSTGITSLVSVPVTGDTADGPSQYPLISDDGRYVVFQSRATNLVSPATTSGRWHAYRRDLLTGTTALVSVAADGASEANDSLNTFNTLAITPDARLIAFASFGTNLLAVADANGTISDVFVRDMVSETTELVSQTTSGAQANVGSSSPVISADGRFVAFVAGYGTPAAGAIFVHDRHRATTTATPLPGAPAVNQLRSISGDGRFIGFTSYPYSSGSYLYDRDVLAAAYLAPGTKITGICCSDPDAITGPVVSRDGRSVLVDTPARLLPEDTRTVTVDVYLFSVPQQATDAGVYRGSAGTWLIARAFNNTEQTANWGSASQGDVPVFADYDGDGRNDIAVYRNTSGEWIVSLSSGGSSIDAWGAPSLGDRPVPADYDGDGKADKAVYRQNTGEWVVAFSSGDWRVDGWGSPAARDTPVPADYDGDGKADRAVYRQSTGEWFIAHSSGGIDYVAWGAPAYGDLPVPGDYDGDGRADVAVYRATTAEWFVRSSGSASLHTTFGSADQHDVPVPADYDSDGIVDLAVWRPGTGEWFIWQSSSQTLRTLTLGAAGDTPITLPFALR
jgi:Tol biopolymer transport system component